MVFICSISSMFSYVNIIGEDEDTKRAKQKAALDAAFKKFQQATPGRHNKEKKEKGNDGSDSDSSSDSEGLYLFISSTRQLLMESNSGNVVCLSDSFTKESWTSTFMVDL